MTTTMTFGGSGRRGGREEDAIVEAVAVALWGGRLARRGLGMGLGLGLGGDGQQAAGLGGGDHWHPLTPLLLLLLPHTTVQLTIAPALAQAPVLVGVVGRVITVGGGRRSSRGSTRSTGST